MAGEITVALAEELAIRIEDEEEIQFSQDTKIKMLDKAQLELCNFLHDAYLTEFETTYTPGAGSYTSVAFSLLNSGLGVLRGSKGIIHMVATIAALPKWTIEIELDEIKKTENSYQAYSNTRPMRYVFNETVYLLSTSAATNLTLYYLKNPPALTTGVDPLLNSSLHHLMLDLAEAKCWAMNRQFERRQSVMDHALRQIEILNAKYTAAEGIGTKDKGGK
jgi:hypothetical protein